MVVRRWVRVQKVGFLLWVSHAIAFGVGCRASTTPPAPPAPAADHRRAARPKTTTPSETPTTVDGCRACNGLWAIHGLATTESCNCRTHDSGKRCRDGAECEGACVAAVDQPEHDVTDRGPPARGYFVGRCSEFVTVFGCNRFIERGATSRGPVLLDEEPPQLCVD